jgi:hypothetical protein
MEQNCSVLQQGLEEGYTVSSTDDGILHLENQRKNFDLF